jgi:hypothetical protein
MTMTSGHARRLGIALTLIATLATTLVAGTAAQAARSGTTAATWTLVDYQQNNCVKSATGGTTYYGIWISGSWSHSVDVGAQSLPAGASYSTSYAPIAPGSSTGVYSLAYVAVTVPPTAVATYTPSIWASDGVDRQAVPVTLRVQVKCTNY